MSSQDHTLPAAAMQSRTLDSASAWFWQFLKSELAPYPGRAWVVARITIAATLVMIVVMTFQIPFGFLAAVYTFFLSRESPSITLKSGIRTAAMYVVATAYTIVGVMTMVGSPITHFLWITISLFLAFYLIRIFPDYFTAVGFGFTLAGAIPLWDQTYLTVEKRTENTLWLGGAVLIGSVITVIVEYVFRRVHPVTDIAQGIEDRLQAVADLLRRIAAGQPFQSQEKLAQYSTVGTSRLRRTLLRSGLPTQLVGPMNTAIALLGQLIDMAASLHIVRSHQFSVAAPEDRERCRVLADQIAELQRDLKQRGLPQPIPIVTETQASGLPFLPEMERAVALMSHAFSGTESVEQLFLPPPLAPEVRQRLFVPDAFTNPDYLKFAIRGTLATMLAYVIYQSINWPGLSTSVATCIITALTTIGSSRQKQYLRLGGVLLGGVIFGIGAQCFLLTKFDSITGFTILFAAVTAVCAWIGIASARLSYLGVQAALAFYLINLQEFTIQSSLAVARDRLVGVTLGVMCMWLVFDHLWVRDALQEMQDAFSRNLQLLAELIEFATRQALKDQRIAVAKRALQLRDQINEGFNTVKAQADAVVFEFGPSRRRKLRIRDDFRRWQPALGTLMQVQVTGLQYLFEQRYPELAPGIAKALETFEEDMATTARAMADQVSGKIAGPTPDVQEAAIRLREEIEKHYAALGQPAPPSLVDMITITQNLVSIVAPLYLDIHSTFANLHHAAMHHPQTRLREA
ncbi:MAG: FUSC family protein [Candidatus Korobacteraceae bacterium]